MNLNFVYQSFDSKIWEIGLSMGEDPGCKVDLVAVLIASFVLYFSRIFGSCV